MVEGLIFDMDGVLLDSEPFWRAALIQELADLGTTLTEQEAAETMGIRIDQVLEIRQKTHGWTGKSIPDAVDSILNRVIGEVQKSAVLLPGVKEVLHMARTHSLSIGLATSSPARLIEAVLGALNLKEWFEVTRSAESLRYGKPHPEIYLITAEALGIAPEKCLAIEDSLNGVISAKAARMKCVAVPEKISTDLPGFAVADLKLSTLTELQEQVFRQLISA